MPRRDDGRIRTYGGYGRKCNLNRAVFTDTYADDGAGTEASAADSDYMYATRRTRKGKLKAKRRRNAAAARLPAWMVRRAINQGLGAAEPLSLPEMVAPTEPYPDLAVSRAAPDDDATASDSGASDCDSDSAGSGAGAACAAGARAGSGAAASAGAPLATPSATAPRLSMKTDFDEWRRQYYLANRDAFLRALDPRLAPSYATPLSVQRVTPVEVGAKAANRFMERARQLGDAADVAVAFHGTDARYHDSIAQHGLVMPGTNAGVHRVGMAHGSAYGVGIYTSRSASFSVGYCRDTHRMIAVAVLDDATPDEQRPRAKALEAAVRAVDCSDGDDDGGGSGTGGGVRGSGKGHRHNVPVHKHIARVGVGVHARAKAPRSLAGGRAAHTSTRPYAVPGRAWTHKCRRKGKHPPQSRIVSRPDPRPTRVAPPYYEGYEFRGTNVRCSRNILLAFHTEHVVPLFYIDFGVCPRNLIEARRAARGTYFGGNLQDAFFAQAIEFSERAKAATRVARRCNERRLSSRREHCRGASYSASNSFWSDDSAEQNDNDAGDDEGDDDDGGRGSEDVVEVEARGVEPCTASRVGLTVVDPGDVSAYIAALEGAEEYKEEAAHADLELRVHDALDEDDAFAQSHGTLVRLGCKEFVVVHNDLPVPDADAVAAAFERTRGTTADAELVHNAAHRARKATPKAKLARNKRMASAATAVQWRRPKRRRHVPNPRSDTAVYNRAYKRWSERLEQDRRHEQEGSQAEAARRSRKATNAKARKLCDRQLLLNVAALTAGLFASAWAALAL